MGFWSNLFKKGEDPIPTLEIEGLGTFAWTDDDESWVRIINDCRVALSYEYEAQPKPETIEHAKKYIWYQELLDELLKKIKAHGKREYPEEFHQEIDALEYKSISFFDANRIHIQFFESDDEPWWLAEIYKGEIVNVGFDT